MEPFWSTYFMLPGQEHGHAKAVAEALEHAREGVAMLVGCEPFEIVFTGGGTEANNLAILGLLAEAQPGHLLVSELEHDSVIGAAKALHRRGWEFDFIEVDEQGQVCPELVDRMIRPETRLVSVQAANPILGSLQPIREIADLVHKRGGLIHCDATQVFGKMPLDVNQIKADTIAVSGHKFYGPKGSGAVYIRRGLEIHPISYGDPREMGVRPGPENIPACVGIGEAARLASKCAVDVADNSIELRERFISAIQCTLDPAPFVLCDDGLSLPNTVAIQFATSATRIQKLARNLVFQTTLSGTPPDEMTRALRAIGRTEQQIAQIASFSFGWTTSREQIDTAVELIAESIDSLGQR